MSKIKTHTTDAIAYAIHNNMKFDMKEIEKMFGTTDETKHELSVLTDFAQVEQAIKAAKEIIKMYQDSIEKCRELQELLSTLQYSIGDVAYHPDKGNVVVDGVVLNTTRTAIEGYIIVGRHGKSKVTINELLPYSETTKVLYGNK